MNANEMTFGVELKTIMPTGSVNVGGYCQGRVNDWLPAGWRAKHDGSIREEAGYVGCEFVSPVLRGAEGVRSVMAAVAAIVARGGKVNPSCGTHVHVGFGRDNSKALERLVTLVANFETAIYASTGTRRDQNTYCRSTREMANVANAINSGDRYRILNLTNLRTGRHHTVEFRAFAGTLNVEKIVGHIRMALGLVERAHVAKRVTNWTPKNPVATSPIARSGEGQTHLARLFYQLGWTKGRQSHTFGDVTCEGAPDLKAIKRKLMAMAKKFDSRRN